MFPTPGSLAAVSPGGAAKGAPRGGGKKEKGGSQEAISASTRDLREIVFHDKKLAARPQRRSVVEI